MDFLKYSFILLIINLLVEITLGEEWWEKYKILEKHKVGNKWEFQETQELIHLCRNDTFKLAKVTNPDSEDCKDYVECDYKEMNKSNTIRVTPKICDFCGTYLNTKMRKLDCPKGRLVAAFHLHKGCAEARRFTKEQHKCGTKDPAVCLGPKDSEDIHRLGTSNFYVLQNEKTMWTTWEEAKKKCEKLGLRIAVIDNIQTDVYVSRELEKFILTNGWIDNWYWLGAKFDRKLKTYVWRHSHKPIKYSNFYYRSPRPKGYGDFYNNNGKYQVEPQIEHCLAISMPLPFPKSINPKATNQLINYPFHTSWWERECESKKKGNVLCESEHTSCEHGRDLSMFTELEGKYYEEFWPMSNRKFVVMWTAKSFDEAKKLCEDNNMEIYSPHQNDTCLPQNLKNWMNSVTSYSFWTDLKYKVGDRKFIDANGLEVSHEMYNVTVRVKRAASKLQEADILEETCASITYNFEDFPQNPNFCNCTFKSVVLSPENCINKIGVICQPRDKNERECTTEFYESVETTAGNVTADQMPAKLKEFYAFDSNPDYELGIQRSAYKQPGSTGQCLEGYRRVTENDTYWETDEDFEKSAHPYDFLASYWMKPITENGTTICKLSTVFYEKKKKPKLRRELKEEDCSKFLGFILCKNKPDDKAPIQSGRAMMRMMSQNTLADEVEEPMSISQPE